jgi:salicylate hydroxylase
MTRVAIIGAGIGGLAPALALRKSGLDVVVLEQTDRLRAVGAGIQLSPNANHVLARLGVLDAIIDVAFEPRSLDIVDGQRGRTVRADMVIGADGVHSVVRQQVVTETRPAAWAVRAYKSQEPR